MRRQSGDIDKVAAIELAHVERLAGTLAGVDQMQQTLVDQGVSDKKAMRQVERTHGHAVTACLWILLQIAERCQRVRQALRRALAKTGGGGEDRKSTRLNSSH